ncbi:MAG: HEAT repeat domain-containing protein [Pirellulaceae bacterium]
MDPALLDEAFEALKTYDWGADRKALNPLDEAVHATHDDPEARKHLEARLAAVLQTDVSRDAKDVVCRLLMSVGTAASVPTLAALLASEELSHMARYALERIPAPEAAEAMRTALSELSGKLKVGVIGSLGVRRDADSVPLLAKLLSDADPLVACAAACALGTIRTSDAAQVLAKTNTPDAEARRAVIDASLACADEFLANGKRAEALAVYKRFVSDDQPKHVRLAATRGMLACAGTSK